MEQARQTHRTLDATIVPEVVLVSPHVRAIDTARTVFPQCSGETCRMTPFVVREELRERCGVMLNVQRRTRQQLEAIADYADCDFGHLAADDTLWTEAIESWEKDFLIEE